MTKLEDMDEVINPNTGHKVNMKKLITDQNIALQMVSSKYPFFERLLRELTWIYTFQVPTQATDGTRLLVNPEFTAGLSMKMKCFVMMHEVMHCVLDHMNRGRNHDHWKANIAADYEVNGNLVDSNVLQGSDLKEYLYDSKYSGWEYEHIYADQPPGPKKPQPQMGGQQGSGENDKNGSGSGSGSSGDSGNPQQEEHSKEYVDGWNKAIEDYLAGKIKL